MNNLFINKDFTIKKTFKYLNNTSYKCLIVLEKNDKTFLGTISDGDIRKAILKGVDLNQKINKIFNANPFYFSHNNYDTKNLKEIFLQKKLPFIPVINNKKKILKIIFWDDLFKNKNIKNQKKIDIPIVIMAGGKGVRLQPFTNILPKPLIPINNKPIIEYIIENFLHYNFKHFYLSLNYKSKILKAYFEEMKRDFKVDYIEEKTPLGTVGSLKLLEKKITKSVIVTNCDIIININYLDFIKFHNDNKNDITFLAFSKKFEIPYGICDFDKYGNFLNIKEKQGYNYIVNAGMYIVSAKMLKLIPKNKIFHMTELINIANTKKFRISAFPIEEDQWIDIGQWNQYKEAVESFKK